MIGEDLEGTVAVGLDRSSRGLLVTELADDA
jgi:hypothetical protein